MKPINFKDDNCESKSSSCVIWAGPKIDCINLCTGDSVTQAVYNLALELCKIMEQLDVTNYDLTCLKIDNGEPKDFTAFINIIIQKICSLNGITDSSSAKTSNGTISDITVNLAECFYYNDPSNGDQVVTSPLSSYVQRIGIAICSLLSSLTAQQNALSSLTNRVATLETEQPVSYVLPNLFPICVGDPNTALSLDEFAKNLEQYFCELSQAVGSNNNIYSAISAQPADFNSAKAVGTGGGTMGEKNGWSLDPKNLADGVVNVWITLADLRSAVRNIQQNCCNTLCDGIRLDFEATLQNKVLSLFFTGSVPDNLISCLQEGSLFKIEDYSGNSVNVSVNIKNNINNPSGFAVDLDSTPLNFADDLKVTSLFCFTDPSTGSMCQNYLETIVSNNLNCPTVTLTPGIYSVAYQFTHTSGILTYSVQLFNASNEMVQSRNVSVSNTPVVISDVFSSLQSNANYKIRLQLITINSTKSCPYTAFVTMSNPCPAPSSVSAQIVIT